MSDQRPSDAVVARADGVAGARRPGRGGGGRLGHRGHRDARPDPVIKADVAQAAGGAGAQPRGHAADGSSREAAPDVDRLAGVPRRRRGRDGGVRVRRPAATARLNGEPLELSRSAVYTLAFFAFWFATMASSALTTLLARSPFEVNRCPLPIGARPAACPKPQPRWREARQC